MTFTFKSGPKCWSEVVDAFNFQLKVSQPHLIEDSHGEFSSNEDNDGLNLTIWMILIMVIWLSPPFLPSLTADTPTPSRPPWKALRWWYLLSYCGRAKSWFLKNSNWLCYLSADCSYSHSQPASLDIVKRWYLSKTELAPRKALNKMVLWICGRKNKDFIVFTEKKTE